MEKIVTVSPWLTAIILAVVFLPGIFRFVAILFEGINHLRRKKREA